MKFSVTIEWGDGTSDILKPEEYSFDTEAERDAFMLGVDSALGWLDYDILDMKVTDV